MGELVGRIQASCGHTLSDNSDGVPVRYKEQTREGRPAIAYATFCESCAEEWKKNGDLLPGAVDFSECDWLRVGRNCKCRRCKVCGHQKHTGIHGPINGEGPGSVPYGHDYAPIDLANHTKAAG